MGEGYIPDENAVGKRFLFPVYSYCRLGFCFYCVTIHFSKGSENKTRKKDVTTIVEDLPEKKDNLYSVHKS